MTRSSHPPAPPAVSAPFDRRSSGVLLHPTSLAGGYGSGDLGPSARKFVDFLRSAGQRYWQMLPICPPGHGYSPYDSPSSFAISEALLSLEELAKTPYFCASDFEELMHSVLDANATDAVPPDPRQAAERDRASGVTSARRADFSVCLRAKTLALKTAHRRFRETPSEAHESYRAFCEKSAHWLEDHAIFLALKAAFPGLCWTAWPQQLRDRTPSAIAQAKQEHADSIDFYSFCQFELHRQWEGLRRYCEESGVLLIGDVPIYVSHDSADVWSHREVFCLSKNGEREVVAGVPPDYFSSTGQLWGNPLYKWSTLKRTNYAWWVARLKTCLERFDAVRLDHFIGFRRYWEVPATAATAETGRYLQVPGEQFFSEVRERMGGLPFIAEDLGVVTDEVTQLRRRFNLPGMKILQFAFDDPAGSDYLPHRYESNTTVYTGTHDNDTSVGWFHSAPPGDDQGRAWHAAVRDRVRRYLDGDADPIHWKLIRLALGSVANTAIIPVQDLLGLGSEARMNTPGTTEGNWSFRLLPGELDETVAGKLRHYCAVFDRLAT